MIPRPTPLFLVVTMVLSLLTPVAQGGSDMPRPKWDNLATGKAVTFNTPPNYPDTTDEGDATQLTDGALGEATPLWYDKAAVGWMMVDPAVFTLDLGKDQPIRGVGVRLGAGQSGVEWPSRIQVLVSEDGKKFSFVGDLVALNKKAPPRQGYAAHWLVADGLETHGRFVKLLCSPTNLGTGAYIIMDELQVYRGEDEWLERPLVAANAPERWEAKWSEMTWDVGAGVPTGELPRDVKLVDGDTVRDDEPLHEVKSDTDAVTFRVRGEAGQPRRMNWTYTLDQPVSTENCRFAVLTFRADHVRRMYESFPIVELRGVSDSGGGDENTVTLLDAIATRSDGRSHTLIKPLPADFSLHQVRVSLITESSTAGLVLERLELLDAMPAVLSDAIRQEAGDPRDGFEPVPLDGRVNHSLAAWAQEQVDEHGVLLDGATRLEPGMVEVSGVPFSIADGERNLAAMPMSRPTDDRVEFLGEMVDKRYLNPESRHDKLAIDVDADAREVMLLLALQANPAQRRGGHTYAALALTDIESLSVELVYDDDSRTLAFPYSLADQAPVIPSRGLGAYAVAADPGRRLKQVVLHNRHFGPNFALAGLTLNTSSQAVVPQLAEVNPPTPTAQLPDPSERPLAVTHEGDRLTFSNRWYECGLDLSQGFVIDRFVNRWDASAPVSLGESSGLRIRVDDTVYTGRSFNARVEHVEGNRATLKLTSKRHELPLSLDVTITADDSPELRFAVQAINRGQETLTPDITLPALDAVSIGGHENTRLFFPQYRAVDTARDVTLNAPYGPEFTQQFMNIHNRDAGLGLTIRTDNTAQHTARFTLAKNEAGVSGGVVFDSDYTPLEPRGSQDYPPVSLIAHAGDWRDALRQHREWVRGWYEPVESQDEEFFLNAWNVMCHRVGTKLSWLENKTPGYINPDKTRFLTEEHFAFDEQTLGYKPDFIHFFNWTHSDESERNEYGVHGTDHAFAQVGGIDFFREGIREIQEDYDTPVSLYALIDRVRSSTLEDPDLAAYVAEASWYQVVDNDSSAGLRANRTVDGLYYMPAGDERWLDFALADVVNMQKRTGCKLVYLDVFSHWSHLNHNNGVSPREADLMILERLRDELPDEVVFWSEYPATDVGSQYADGALTYYFLDLNETFARRYDDTERPDGLHHAMPMNAARFILTDYKSIGLPVYIEAGNGPSQVDAAFVNGEAFQEDTYRLHHSRIRTKLNRSYEIKHQYNDCFTSDSPLPQVDTAVQGVTANLFPGEGRNLWTLYNGRPSTYSGVVLEVPHQEGATYHDAWNNIELTPTIKGGIARIELTLDPQQPGCVVQTIKE